MAGAGAGSGAPLSTLCGPSKTPKMGARIILSGDQYRLASTIGKRRNDVNRSKGIRDQRFATTRTSEDVSVQGVIGEVAFLTMFGLSLAPVYDTRPNCAKFDRFDGAIAGTHEMFDVKTTWARARGLMVLENKVTNPPTYFALMTMLDHDPEAGIAILRYDGMLPSGLVMQAQYFDPGLFRGAWMVPRCDLVNLDDARDSLPPPPEGDVWPWDVDPSRL